MPFFFYMFCAPLVIAPAVIGVMLRTVDFYGQSGLMTVKVKDKRGLYLLTAKFDGIGAEVLVPEFLLLRSHPFSQGGSSDF